MCRPPSHWGISMLVMSVWGSRDVNYSLLPLTASVYISHPHSSLVKCQSHINGNRPNSRPRPAHPARCATLPIGGGKYNYPHIWKK